VFDAAATGDEFAKALFKELKEEPKLFSSTNSWYENTNSAYNCHLIGQMY
jgi:hypothetical protein